MNLILYLQLGPSWFLPWWGHRICSSPLR